MSGSNRPMTPEMLYGFDPQFYLREYPNFRLQELGVNPEEHYYNHGRAAGAARNQYEQAGLIPVYERQLAERSIAPPPDRNPTLDPSDPASWASFRERAHASTEGLNRMPYVAPDTATLSRDPYTVQRQFYPGSSIQGAPGSDPSPGPLGYTPPGNPIAADPAVTGDPAGQLATMSDPQDVLRSEMTMRGNAMGAMTFGPRDGGPELTGNAIADAAARAPGAQTVHGVVMYGGQPGPVTNAKNSPGYREEEPVRNLGMRTYPRGTFK